MDGSGTEYVNGSGTEYEHGTDACTKVWKTLIVLESITVICGVLFIVLVVFGTHRSRCNPDNRLFLLVRNTPAVSRSLIALAAGMTFSAVSLINDFLVFWILFLMIVVANSDSFSASNLEDINKTGKELGVYYLLPSFYTGYALGFYPLHDRLRYTTWILFIAYLGKLNDLLISHLNASKSYGLAKYSKMISDYMSHQHDSRRHHDVQSLEGYTYLFTDEKRGSPVEKPPRYVVVFDDPGSVITIDRVWKDAPSLNEELKDVFLSYSLFNLLKRSVAEYPMAERDQHETISLVLEGLLSGNDNERAFRVVEVELGFLFDYFFTKYAVVWRTYGFRIKMKSGLSVWIILCCCLSLSWLGKHQLSDKYCYTDLDLPLTQGIIALILIAEAVQLVKLFISNWFKVYLITLYLRASSSERRKKTIQEVMLSLWKLEKRMPGFYRKLWSRKIHQYSLLHSYSYHPNMLERIFYAFTDLVLLMPRQGQKKGRFMTFSTEVNRALLDSLRKKVNGGAVVLKNGKSSLRLNGVLESLRPWSCTEESDTSIQILVWHIATTLVDDQHGLPETADQKHRVVSTQLSNYCAHLVAFLPELLPGNAHRTEVIFDAAVREMQNLLKTCKTPKERCEKARQHTSCEVDNLANELLKTHGQRRWKILADFWAEIMLFIAPSDRPEVHVEHLTKGVQLITQIWALLYHAGVPDRRRLDEDPNSTV